MPRSRAVASRTRARSRPAWVSPRIPVIAETVALRTILELWRATGARVHLRRLSSAAGVALVRRGEGARARRSPATSPSITCTFATGTSATSTRNCNLIPPLRDPARPRRAAPRRSPTARSTRSARTTRRSTTTRSRCPFAEAEPGATGARTAAAAHAAMGPGDGAAARRSARRGHASRRRASWVLPSGTLAPGAAADICLFDPGAPWGVRARARSRARARTRRS